MSLYPIFYYAAFITFVVILRALLRSQNLDIIFLNLFVISYILGMFFGCHALHFLFRAGTLTNPYLRAFYDSFLSDPSLYISEVGFFPAYMNFYKSSMTGLWGGPLFVIITLLPIIVLFNIPGSTKVKLLNIFAIVFPFSLSGSKLACLSGGCCHGIEGEGLFFIKFSWIPKTNPNYLKSFFPTQALDLIIYLIIGIVLYRLHVKQKSDKLFLLFLLFYSIGRFLSEFTRGDNVGGKYFGLSPVQIILIISFAISLLFLCKYQYFKAILYFHSNDRINNFSTKNKLSENLCIFMILLPVVYIFIFPPILLLLFAIPVIINTRRIKQFNNNPIFWQKLFNQFVYFILGYFFISTYLLVNFLPFYVGIIIFIIIKIALLNKYLFLHNTVVDTEHGLELKII